MLTENQINMLPERVCERIKKINSEYLESIGHVIKEIGELRPKDVHQLQQMYNYGADVNKISRDLANASEKNIAEIYEMFDIVAQENYEYAKPFYKAKGMSFIPYEQNSKLKTYVKALAAATVKEYTNLTQHTAFAVFEPDGKSIAPLFEANKNKLATSLSDTYTKIIDYAVTKVQLGEESYQSAMREAIKSLAASGIKTVDYATGYSRRLDTSVRQNILWGIKQCNQNTADMVGEEFGADGYEISYHSNPRPSHADMGGRQYAIGKARTIDGVYYPSFDDVAHLLEEYNCLHFKFPILLGIDNPAYTEEQLEEFKANDKKTFEFEGKRYTGYEGTQLQRRIESEVRNQKDLANAAKAAGDDDLRREAQYKINLLTNKYAKLSQASGLPTKMEKMSVPKSKTVLTKNIKSVTIKEKEIEYGVPYGDFSVKANMNYINSNEYARKFSKITENEEVNQSLLELSRKTINHRNGTMFEDMYIINANDGTILGQQTEMQIKSCITYNDSILSALKKAKEEKIPIIALHNHPEGFPPSVDDFNKAYENNYMFGIASGHNGQVYLYNKPSNITNNPKAIHEIIAQDCERGIDVDRAHSEMYKLLELSYKILKGE